jgi:peptidoglycan/LPS O-acetylase OafA/YrhL
MKNLLYSPLNERRTNNYDFLRIIAAICIAITHSFNLLARNAEEPMMKISGQRYDFSFIGLSIFFSISGYLITRSAIQSTSLRNYYWKRFLRIQPLLFIIALLSVLIVGPVFTSLSVAEYFSNSSTWTFFRNIFPPAGIQFTLPGVFTNNVAEPGVNGSLWTLIVEERLYIAVNLLFLFKSRGRNVAIIAILLADTLYILNEAFFNHTLISYLNSSSSFFALLFLNGGLLFLLGPPTLAFFQKKGLVVLLLLAGLSIVYLPLAFMQIAAIPGLVIVIANIRAVTNRAGAWGDFTYGIYIFTFPVQQMIISLNNSAINPYLLFAEAMLVVVPLAVMSWYFVEKKCLKMRHLVS